jgi:hypothetical protein
MTTTPKRQNPCTLTPGDDGALIATWPTHRYRYLLSDGSIVDVLAVRDDSDLRDALLTYTGVDRIEGSARL